MNNINAFIIHDEKNKLEKLYNRKLELIVIMALNPNHSKHVEKSQR